MTIELARAAELAGRVVGVDFDQVKLDLARREAAQQGVSNITFDTRDVSDWEPDESFDVIYARFLLTHLADPRKVISTMHKHLRPGGALVVEDVDFRGHFSEPDCPALRR